MSTLLYVGNLPHGVSCNDLAEVFSCISPVIDAKIGRQRAWGELNFCGWVTVPDADAAARAVHYLHGRSFFGASLVVRPARRESAPLRLQNLLH